MTLTAQNILQSPDYYPLRLDGPNLLFVRMSRDSYADSVFTLPNRIVTAGPEQWSVPFAELVELIERAKIKLPPPSCVFQIAHCGSTLLSRALDKPKSNLVIREPFTLRQFAASPAPVSAPDITYRRRALAALWHLFSRQYSNDQAVMLKANVPVNFVIDQILETAPETSGILLYCEFEAYLLSVLKADERRLWAQHVVKELMPAIQQQTGFKHIDFSQLSAAQSAALLWLSQIHRFENAAKAHRGLRSLHCEDFFQQPAAILQAASRHLGDEMKPDHADQVVASGLFTHHSKNINQEYSEQQRQLEQRQLAAEHGDELDACQQWLEQQGFNTSHTLADQALTL